MFVLPSKEGKRTQLEKEGRQSNPSERKKKRSQQNRLLPPHHRREHSTSSITETHGINVPTARKKSRHQFSIPPACKKRKKTLLSFRNQLDPGGKGESAQYFRKRRVTNHRHHHRKERKKVSLINTASPGEKGHQIHHSVEKGGRREIQNQGGGALLLEESQFTVERIVRKEIKRTPFNKKARCEVKKGRMS